MVFVATGGRLERLFGKAWKDVVKKWHELTNLMTCRVAEERPTHQQTILLLVGLGGALRESTGLAVAIDLADWATKHLVQPRNAAKGR